MNPLDPFDAEVMKARLKAGQSVEVPLWFSIVFWGGLAVLALVGLAWWLL